MQHTPQIFSSWKPQKWEQTGGWALFRHQILIQNSLLFSGHVGFLRGLQPPPKLIKPHVSSFRRAKFSLRSNDRSWIWRWQQYGEKKIRPDSYFVSLRGRPWESLNLETSPRKWFLIRGNHARKLIDVSLMKSKVSWNLSFMSKISRVMRNINS